MFARDLAGILEGLILRLCRHARLSGEHATWDWGKETSWMAGPSPAMTN
jgi:hypothetical protein